MPQPTAFAPSALRLGRPAESPLWTVAAIVARVRWLIAHQDGGDVCAAAHRLGVPVGELVRLEQTLAVLEAPGVPDTDDGLLTAVVRRYGVDAAWLLTGCRQPDTAALPADLRERLAGLLLAVARSVVSDCQAAGTLGGGAGLADAPA